MKAFLRPGRILKWMGGALLLFAASIVAILVALQTAPVRALVRTVLVHQLDKTLNASVEIGGIEGNFITHLGFRNIRLSTAQGPALSVARVSLRYAIPLLLKRMVYIRSVDLSGIEVNLITRADGKTNFFGLLKNGGGKTAPSGASGMPLRVVVGSIHIENSRLRLKMAGDAAGTRVIRVQELAARLGYTGRLTLGIERARIAMNRPELQQLVLSGTAVFDPASGRLSVDRLAVRARLPGTSLGALARFEGRFSDTGSLENAQLRVRLSPSQVDAWRVEKGLLNAAVRDGRIDIRGLRLTGNFGRLQASASGTGFMEGAATKHLDLSLFLSDKDLRGVPLLGAAGIAGEAALKLTCQGKLPADFDLARSELRINASLQNAKVSFRGTSLTGGRLKADIHQGQVRLLEAGLDTSSGRIEMSGVGNGFLSKGPPRRASFTARARGLDLSALFGGTRMRGRGDAGVKGEGEATVSGTVTGSLDRPDIAFQIEGRRLALSEVSTGTLSGEGKWRPGPGFGTGAAKLRLTHTVYRGNRFKSLALSAAVSNRAVSFDGNLTHESGNALRAAGRVELPAQGQVRVALDTLRFSSPRYAMLDALVNQGPLKLDWAGDVLKVAAFHMTSRKAAITLAGHLGMTGQNDLRLEVAHLDLDRLSWLWDGNYEARGLLSGRITIAGSLAVPVVKVQIHGRGLSGRGFGSADADMAATYAHGRTTASIDLNRAGKPVLSGRGTVTGALSLRPFKADFDKGALNAFLRIRHLRLSDLPLPVSKEVAFDAVADADITVGGSVQAPRVKGDLRLEDGYLTLPKNGLTYETVTAKIHIDQDRLDIRKLLLRGDREGTLEVAGRVDLEGIRPHRVDLTFRGKDFLIPYQKAIEARISPRLSLKGPVDALSLAGEITLTQGKINLDRMAPQTPPDIQIVGATAAGNGKERIAEETPEPEFIHHLTTRITIKAPRNVWLKGQDLNAEIGGNLTLGKRSGKSFTLVGALRTIRGFYYFQGRRFVVQKGTVNFIGLKEPNPVLDIQAQAKIRDALIMVLISGTARHLVLRLDSDPKMDPSDIISYIVFGKSTDSLKGGQAFSVEKAALGLTGNLVASELRRLLGDVFFLDSFSIESGENGGFGAVTLGKYLSPDLYVSYQYTGGEEQTSQVDVSYEIDPNLRLETQAGNDQTSGVDLFWEFDF